MNSGIARFEWAVLSAVVLGGCAKTEKAPPQAAAAPPTVHVVATEYAFQAPDTLPAGLTAFHLMNNGKEPHHLTLIRLAPGQKAAELANMDPTKPMPEGMSMVGGPNFSTPGGTAEATVDLVPGDYVMVCLIPAASDGKPHLLHGMVHPFTVTANPAASAAAPTPDITIKLSDYSFEETPELKAGHHVIKVENAGPQTHELVLIKLDAGKTAQDFLQWAEKLQGPPPATPAPGAAPMSSGGVNYVTADLTAGDYALVCFVLDSKDGKPHFMHGMVKQLTVN